MRFAFYEIGGREITPENVISYEITSEVGAPCDGLRVSFEYSGALGEINGVKVYDDGELIFSGFCDMQKMTVHSGGFRCFIYARSSASILVDNEAVPFEYNKPNANQLCFNNTQSLGFTCALPEIYSESSYVVSKGKSCFACVNDFVCALTSKNIYVTPNNEIRLLERSRDVKNLFDFNVSELSYVINRSEPLSCVDYKINSADDYVYHFKSGLAESRGIKRKRLLNLSSVPEWQGNQAAAEMIKRSLDEYQCAEAVICGKCTLRLCDAVDISRDDFPASGDFTVCEITRIKNKNGEKTVLLLKKENESELINYVD